MARIANEPALSAQEMQALYDGLTATDPPTQPRHFVQLTLALRDENGLLVGALTGSTAWKWLAIDVLWVHEAFRNRGHGTALMQQAESIARDRGCTGARLDTFDFQARPFYERLGYEVYGALDNFPAGHTQFHMRKRLIERVA